MGLLGIKYARLLTVMFYLLDSYVGQTLRYPHEINKIIDQKQ